VGTPEDASPTLPPLHEPGTAMGGEKSVGLKQEEWSISELRGMLGLDAGEGGEGEDALAALPRDAPVGRPRSSWGAPPLFLAHTHARARARAPGRSAGSGSGSGSPPGSSGSGSFRSGAGVSREGSESRERERDWAPLSA